MPVNSSRHIAGNSSHPRTPGVVLLAKDIKMFLGRISGVVRKRLWSAATRRRFPFE